MFVRNSTIGTALIVNLMAGMIFLASPTFGEETSPAPSSSPEAAPEPAKEESKAPAAKPKASSAAAKTKSHANKTVTTKSGLKYKEVKEGSGTVATSSKKVTVHYTGWLKKENGKKFDSSVDRGQPFSFNLGKGEVIKGWDEGVEGMKVGGIRLLTIPAKLGYGERGAGGVIPPNSTLVFKVELLGVN